MWSIWTEPSFAIGERAIFLETPGGNVLWDCIANLDQRTVDFIKSKGGIQAMIVSHPHFYTSMLDWAEEFECPLYLAADESGWLCRTDKGNRIKWIHSTTEEILPGVNAIKLGGHFPGSMVLHWDGKIFTADTIAVTLVCDVLRGDRALRRHADTRLSLGCIARSDQKVPTHSPSCGHTRISFRCRPRCCRQCGTGSSLSTSLPSTVCSSGVMFEMLASKERC